MVEEERRAAIEGRRQAEARCSTLEKEIEQLNAVAQATAMSRQDLLNQIAALSTELADKEGRFGPLLDEARSSKSALEVQVASLHHTLRSLDSEKDKLRSQLDDRDVDLERARNQVEELSEEVAKLSTRENALQTELVATIESRKEEGERAREELSNLETVIRSAENRMGTAETAERSALTNLSAMGREASSLSAEVLRLRQRAQWLEKDLGNTDQQRQALLAGIRRLEGERDQAVTAWREAADSNERHNELAQSWQTQQEELRSQIEALGNLVQTKAAEVEAAVDARHQVEADLEAANEQMTKLAKTLEETSGMDESRMHESINQEHLLPKRWRLRSCWER